MIEEVGSGISKTFLETGVMGAVALLVIIAAAIAIRYLISIIKELKAELAAVQAKYEKTILDQIAENRNIGQLVESLAGQKTLMADIHMTLKMLEKGAAR